jgi:hypothetical protein
MDIDLALRAILAETEPKPERIRPNDPDRIGCVGIGPVVDATARGERMRERERELRAAK